MDQTITLTASGTPVDGSYFWSHTPNLVPNGKTAQLTGFVPTYSDYIRVIVTYTSPEGKKCPATKWIWVCICYVKITGPPEVKVGETITLSAEGDPPGGTYSWTPVDGLEANGSSAQFTGQSPGDITIEVTYATPDGETCTKTHTITVLGECSVTISGPSVVKVGETIILSAEGDPSGGAYEWSDTLGLEPNGSTAQFTSQSPGDVTIEVTYSTPEGEICSATHTVTVFQCSIAISGPSEVKVGETITLVAEGEPSGGTYTWLPLPGLEANGSSAQFTGQSPGDVTIEVTYSTPEGRTCTATDKVAVNECSVTISGPSEVKVCENITLTAEGDPPGGTYSWTAIPGLEVDHSDDSTARFTGQSAGYVTIEVSYTPPDGGGPCDATHGVTVKTECRELAVPLFKQCSSPWGSDTYDHIASSICGKGCALTSAVMVLRYYGVTTGIDGKEVNPKNLNEWLKSQPKGYDGPRRSLVNWFEIARYSRSGVIYSGSIIGRNDKALNDDLCKGRPVTLNVPNHFVVAKGKICSNSETTWTINDPGRNITTLQGYNNTYKGLRRFRPHYLSYSSMVLGFKGFYK